MLIAKLIRWQVGLTGLLWLTGLLGGCPPQQEGPPVLDDDYKLGSTSAPVVVIEYGDFECPVCGRFDRETFPTIKRDYIDTGEVLWVFRHFPLTSVHPNAEAAARAAECANQQDEFWAYHDELFDNQEALSDEDLDAYGAAIGLDASDFDACRAAAASATRVQRDVDSGTELGVTGTPTFFINGTVVRGFRSADAFAGLLDQALGTTPTAAR